LRYMYTTIDKYGFLVYPISKDDLQIAEATLADVFPSTFSLNSRTIHVTRHHRMAGILGEIVFKKLFREAIQSPSQSVPYDFILKGRRIDVKCKCRNVEPKGDFEASIFDYQSGKGFEETDIYVFMSTTKKFKTMWVCGYSKKKDFMSDPNCVLWKKGDTDKRNNITFKADTWCLPYKNLRKFKNDKNL